MKTFLAICFFIIFLGIPVFNGGHLIALQFTAKILGFDPYGFDLGLGEEKLILGENYKITFNSIPWIGGTSYYDLEKGTLIKTAIYSGSGLLYYCLLLIISILILRLDKCKGNPGLEAFFRSLFFLFIIEIFINIIPLKLGNGSISNGENASPTDIKIFIEEYNFQKELKNEEIAKEKSSD